MSPLTNILVVGVGGQGVLVASEIIAEAAALGGLEVKKSEVHGMAQRGGSVVSHLRFGRTVYSPLVSHGEADFLVAFEKLEALRYLDYLKPSSWVLINDQEIHPLPVSTGRKAYPQNIKARLKQGGYRCKVVDGIFLASAAGNIRTVNSVLLGLLSKLLAFEKQTWEEALRLHVPARHHEANARAFELGRKRRIMTSK